jgi:hypothetical protein
MPLEHRSHLVLAPNARHFVNPHQVAAQVEGGVVMGLRATYFGG